LSSLITFQKKKVTFEFSRTPPERVLCPPNVNNIFWRSIISSRKKEQKKKKKQKKQGHSPPRLKPGAPCP
jgi:hypothetical protein